MPRRRRALVLHVAAGIIAAVLPVGLVSAAGHVSRSQFAASSELLQLVTPPSPTHARRRAPLPRHASAWPTPSARRSTPRAVGRRLAAAKPHAVRPAAPSAVAPTSAASPGLTTVEPVLEPRPPEVDAVGPLPPVVDDAPDRLPVPPAPSPSAAPVAEAATVAPIESPPASAVVVPAPEPVVAPPPAPVSHEGNEEHDERSKHETSQEHDED